MATNNSVLAAIMGGAGGALSGLGRQSPYDALAAQQQMAYINAYDNWITTATTACSGTTSSVIMFNGMTVTPDEVDIDPVRRVIKKKDEFAWLRDRVNEMCWREAA